MPSILSFLIGGTSLDLLHHYELQHHPSSLHWLSKKEEEGRKGLAPWKMTRRKRGATRGGREEEEEARPQERGGSPRRRRSRRAGAVGRVRRGGCFSDWLPALGPLTADPSPMGALLPHPPASLLSPLSPPSLQHPLGRPGVHPSSPGLCRFLSVMHHHHLCLIC